MSAQLGSIVIAAHDEEAVIGRTLEHLRGVVGEGLVDVIVVCNGCHDRTAEVARGFGGVRVSELTQPSKVAALRAGDRLAVAGPRIYLDADIELTGEAAVATLRALAAGAVAGRPPCRFDTSGAHSIVRRWYAVRASVPSINRALWGAGCYALSEGGRSRFDEFPEVLADDIFIDSLFSPEEVTIVPTDPVVVHTPRTVADLVRIRRRSYRGQAQAPRVRSPGHPRGKGQRHDLLALLRADPARVVDVGIYTSVIIVARFRALIGPAPRWERDESSRRAD